MPSRPNRSATTSRCRSVCTDAHKPCQEHFFQPCGHGSGCLVLAGAGDVKSTVDGGSDEAGDSRQGSRPALEPVQLRLGFAGEPRRGSAGGEKCQAPWSCVLHANAVSLLARQDLRQNNHVPWPRHGTRPRFEQACCQESACGGNDSATCTARLPSSRRRNCFPLATCKTLVSQRPE